MLTETADKKLFFQENGYIGPFSPHKDTAVRLLGVAIDHHSSYSNGRTAKYSIISGTYGDRKAHLYSHLVFDAVTQSDILNHLSIYLGPNVLLWASQIVLRSANSQGQFWHIDSINWKVQGVHVSIAISDMNLSNGCLQVIPKTHQYNVSQSELKQYIASSNASLWDAEAMVDLADKLHPENAPHQLVSLEMTSGQYAFTKGGLWHCATSNQSSIDRRALLARYMRPEIIPRVVDGEELSCILVQGEDHHSPEKLYPAPRTWFKNRLLLNYRLNKFLRKIHVH